MDNTAPYLKALFNQAIPSWAVRLVSMLNLIVASLELLNQLKNDNGQLALHPQRYGVKNRSLRYHRKQSIMLRKALGNEWNESIENACLKCYTILATP